MSHLAPVHRCVRPACCVASAVSRATWLLFTGMYARRVVLRVSVLGHLAPVHQCVRAVCCLVRAVSWATSLLFTGVHARRVVSRVQCPGPLVSCSPMYTLAVLCCMCVAAVHRCARSVCCAVSVVSWALGSCSWVCTLGLLCCVCGVLGHLAPGHRCARWACCVACAVSLATWLLFTGVHAGRSLLRVRCPGPLGSCSPVCTLYVLCCVCHVLGYLAPVQGCARSTRCVACAVSWASRLMVTSVHA